MREAASDIRLATDAAANNALKKKLIKRLEVSELSLHYCVLDPLLLLYLVLDLKVLHVFIFLIFYAFCLLATFLTLVFYVQDAAKQASAMTTQLVSAADHTSPANRNPTSQQLLQDQLKVYLISTRW